MQKISCRGFLVASELWKLKQKHFPSNVRYFLMQPIFQQPMCYQKSINYTESFFFEARKHKMDGRSPYWCFVPTLLSRIVYSKNWIVIIQSTTLPLQICVFENPVKDISKCRWKVFCKTHMLVPFTIFIDTVGIPKSTLVSKSVSGWLTVVKICCCSAII